MTFFTPGSINSLFSDFFKEFSGGILGVFETICGVSRGVPGNLLGGIWKYSGRILTEKLFKSYSKHKQNFQNLLNITYTEEKVPPQPEVPFFVCFSASCGPFETKSSANDSYRSPAPVFTGP